MGSCLLLWQPLPEGSASLCDQGTCAQGPQMQTETGKLQLATELPSSFPPTCEVCWGTSLGGLAEGFPQGDPLLGQPPTSCSFTCGALDLRWHCKEAARKQEIEGGCTGKERDMSQSHVDSLARRDAGRVLVLKPEYIVRMDLPRCTKAMKQITF